MIKHLVTTAYRSFKRQKTYSIVNLLGLAIGMYCFLITALYVRDELTFDRWHVNSERIYMSTLKMQRADGEQFNVPPSNALFNALISESTEVLGGVNISRNHWVDFQIGEEWGLSSNFYYSSPSLFEVFDFQLKYGDSEKALSSPKDVVISAEMAQKLFPDENPMNKFVSFQGIGELEVVGVLESIPSNSHLQFDFLASITHPQSRYKDYVNDWVYGVGYSYLLLRDNFNLENLYQDTRKILARNGQEDVAASYNFLKFSDLYLKQQTNRYNNYKFGGQVKYVYIFSLIGGLILFVACFNYINLATSASISTTKQMGIRKVIGASRFNLVSGKMLETLCLATLSLVVAIIAVELTMPFVNSLIGKDLSFNLFHSTEQLFLPVVLLLLVMAISGIYPALALSSFNISSVLKGDQPKSKSSLFKKSLITFQFMICSGLLVAALAIRGQADFLINIDKGFNEENIMSMSLYHEGQSLDYQVIKNKLQSIPQIELITSATLPIFPPPPPPTMVEIEGKQYAMTFITGFADRNFNAVFQLEVLEGSDFSQVTDSELNNVAIINQTAKKKLGLNPAIGAILPNGKKVVGVVKDFFYNSAKEEIQPVSFEYVPRAFNSLQFTYQAINKADVLAQIDLVMKQLGLESSPTITEIEGATDQYNFYETESTLKTIFNILSGMVILVAFLGLFAMASFESNAREKEIGIRKVLGANYLHLLKTLNKHYVWLMMIAFMASIPLSFYLINQWLEDFPYRLDSIKVFGLLAVIIIIAMASMILAVHSYMSSKKNPIEVLRNE